MKDQARLRAESSFYFKSVNTSILPNFQAFRKVWNYNTPTTQNSRRNGFYYDMQHMDWDWIQALTGVMKQFYSDTFVRKQKINTNTAVDLFCRNCKELLSKFTVVLDFCDCHGDGEPHRADQCLS